MAHETRKIEEFEILAETLIEVGRLIQEQVAQARKLGMPEVVMQGRVVFENRARLIKFAGDMKTHLADQYASGVGNSPAQWELNRVKWEQKKAAMAELSGSVPQPVAGAVTVGAEKKSAQARKSHIATPGPAKGSLAGRIPSRRRKKD